MSDEKKIVIQCETPNGYLNDALTEALKTKKTVDEIVDAIMLEMFNDMYNKRPQPPKPRMRGKND